MSGNETTDPALSSSLHFATTGLRLRSPYSQAPALSSMDEIRAENAQLRETLNEILRCIKSLHQAPARPIPTNLSPSEIQQEVQQLVESYRTLQTKHEEVVARYAADCRKWRRFKQWLLVGVVEDDSSARSPLMSKADKENVAENVADNVAERDVEFVPAQELSESLRVTPVSLGKRRAYEVVSSPTPRRKVEVDGAQPGNRGESADQLVPDEKPAQRRGRYSRYENGPTETGPSVRTEEPSFKYDEVVRTRQERKKLHGGDCECCRDYYEAIGPLPPRLQAPLWRTPPSTPAQRRVGRNVDSSDEELQHEANLQDHKQQISRHRARWAAPKTPPGYWDIGFPDTQEVEEIHRAAAAMREESAKAPRGSAAKSGTSKRK